MWMRLLLFPLGLTLGAAEPTVLRSVGSATVRAEPEKADFLLSVVSYGQDAEEAAADNARKTRALIERLEAELGPTAEIRTRHYVVHPNRKYSKRGPEQVTGYSVTNSVHVTVYELEESGAVLALATAAGADQVESVEFGVKDRNTLRQGAFAQATREAWSNAEAMAAALGMEVVRVVRLDDETAASLRPAYQIGRFTETVSVATTTPIRVGEVTERASVVLTVEATPTGGASSTR